MSSANSYINIAPHPQWSFAEVVQHAWQVYTGGGLDSLGRRNVLYRIWAAMVGAERAIAELDNFILQNGSKEAAADSIGCAVSTLQTLRKQFALVNIDAMIPVPLTLAQGEQLRGMNYKYIVENSLGSGGMSVVYRVHRVNDDGVFAAKVLSTERFVITNIVRDRFLRESRLANSFKSPRVVRSMECLLHRGTLVSIMELLSGKTLYQYLQKDRNAFSPAQRVEWLEQIIEGVAYLHSQEIVHRDLSPKNCMLRDDGTFAVGDFGVARRTDDTTLTTTHERMGSLIYISPEQRENPHAAKYSDDVFALGQIAYHLLTGRSPHGGVEQLSNLGYPEDLETWVRNLRNPDQTKRPKNAQDCLITLRNLRILMTSLPAVLP